MWNNKVPKLVRESEGRLNERLALAAAGSCCKVVNSNCDLSAQTGEGASVMGEPSNIRSGGAGSLAHHKGTSETRAPPTSS